MCTQRFLPPNSTSSLDKTVPLCTQHFLPEHNTSSLNVMLLRTKFPTSTQNCLFKHLFRSYFFFIHNTSSLHISLLHKTFPRCKHLHAPTCTHHFLPANKILPTHNTSFLHQTLPYCTQNVLPFHNISSFHTILPP